MMDIEGAWTCNGDPVKKKIGNRSFRHRPKDAASFGATGGGGRDIPERNIVPIRGRAGRGRGRIRGRRQASGIPTRQVKGIIKDVGHGDVGINEVAVGPSPIPSGFPANAILAAVKSATIHQKILDTSLGIAADRKSMTGSKDTITDCNSRHGLRPSQLDHVIPVADIAVFDQNIFSPQIDTVCIRRGPSGRDT